MSGLSKPLYCIAHRGGRQPDASENTLAAINAAIAQGADAIEIDLWQVDGQLLVTHDRRLGKLLPGTGRLLDHSADYLRSLQLPCGNHIPTLDDVLQSIKQQAALNIEIKGPDCAPAVVAALQDYVYDCGGSFEQYIISSFDHPQLYQCQQLLPEVRRGVLVDGIPLDYARCCDALGAYSFHPGIDFISQPLIDDAKQRGLQVWVYTANDIEDMCQLADMGVDGVFTDYPARLIELNKQLRG